MQGNPSTQHYLDDTKAQLICALTSFNVGPCSFTLQEKACCEFKTFLPPHQRFLGLQIHRLYAKDSRCETQPMQTLYKKCRSSCWPRNRGNDLIFVRLRVRVTIHTKWSRQCKSDFAQALQEFQSKLADLSRHNERFRICWNVSRTLGRANIAELTQNMSGTFFEFFVARLFE